MNLKKISTIFMGLGMLTCLQAGEIGETETFWIWIALFSLAIVGIVILFVSSYQARKVQHLHQTLFE